MLPPDSTTDGAPGLNLIPGQRVLLDAKAAARYLGVSTVTLARRRCTGQEPRYYQHAPGGRCHYDIRELDAYLEAHRRQSTSDERGAA